MKIAIVGCGIAGNVVARELFGAHEITVFEAGDHIGGHARTVDIETASGTLAVDTGFIVFNDRNYPCFSALLKEIGQQTQPTVMTFSVRAESGDFEYNGASLNQLFAQRSNFARPGFYRMVRDILRFNSSAAVDAVNADPGMTIGDYLDNGSWSREFKVHYLMPMAAAIWSSPVTQTRNMPLAFLVRFFNQHGLLGLRNRPQWQVIRGGSRAYVDKLVAPFRRRIRLNTPVQWIRRADDAVWLKVSGSEALRFDYAFIATHSDQALALLADPTGEEREVLGAIPYRRNDAILHCDESVLPRRKRAWAAWNYHLPSDHDASVSVTYNMNLLQGFSLARQFCVTLNPQREIEPGSVLRRLRYHHPVFSGQSVRAQARQAELNRDRTFFCGAYWRNGFHEDGVISAMVSVRHFREVLGNAELHFRRAG